jgi:hypothetical protein
MNLTWYQINPDRPQEFLAGRMDDIPQRPRLAVAPPTGQERTYTRVPDRLWSRGAPPSGPIAPGNTRIPDRGVEGRPANAMAAMVVFLSNLQNGISMWVAMRQALNAKDDEARRMLANHRTGGVLAVADVILTYDPRNVLRVPGRPPITNHGPQMQRLAGLWLESGIYGQPAHAIGMFLRRESRASLRPSGGECSFNEYKYFWGVWHEVYPQGFVAQGSG